MDPDKVQETAKNPQGDSIPGHSPAVLFLETMPVVPEYIRSLNLFINKTIGRVIERNERPPVDRKSQYPYGVINQTTFIYRDRAGSHDGKSQSGQRYLL